MTLIAKIVVSLLILDTGNWLGIRWLLLLILIFGAVKSSDLIFSKSVINFFLMLIGSLIFFNLPSVYIAVSSDIPVNEIIPRTFWILYLPTLIVLFYFNSVDDSYLPFVSNFLSLFVIALFIGTELNLDVFVSLHGYLKSDPDYGYFNDTFSIFGVVGKGYYFKFALLFSVFCIYSLRKRFFYTFLFSFAALIISDTKLGILMVLLFLLYESVSRLRPANVLVLVITSFLFYVYIDAAAVLGDISLGVFARLSHFDPIIDNFTIINFFLGSGPGSGFFAESFGFFTRDSEISQLEFIRRYGFISFIVFTVSIMLLISKRYYYLLGALWVICLSNPIIISSPVLVFYSILISSLLHEKKSKLHFSDPL